MNSSAAEILGHFANLKLAGDRVIRDAILSLQSQHPTLSTSAAMRTVFSNPPPRHRRRKRRSTAVNAMSDADLEAELSARRAARARERERYARAMRSEKLSVLESELARLRSEISRLNTTSSLGGGTPPNAKWESLPQTRRLSQNNMSGMGPRSGSLAPRTSTPHAPPLPPSKPIPPLGRDDEPIDAEKQRREKEERQRRREAKRKEREAAKRPMTLADIIRSAGPDPIRRLKPSGSTQLPDMNTLTNAIVEAESKESFGLLRDSLKKAEQIINEKNERRHEGKDTSKKKNKHGERNADENTNENSGNDANQNADKGMSKNADTGTETGERAATEEEIGKRTKAKEGDMRKDIKPENGRVNRTEEKRKEERQNEESSKNRKASDSAENTEDSQIVPNKSKENTKYYSESNGLGHEPLAERADNRVEEKPSSIVADAGECADAEQGSEEAVKNVGKSEKEGKSISTADAISAISALGSNLPENTASATTAKKTAARKSLEERRRLRRVSNSAKSSNSDKTRDEKSAELADTLAAVDALKLS